MSYNKHCPNTVPTPLLTDPPLLRGDMYGSTNEATTSYSLHTERLKAVSAVWRDTVTLPVVAILTLATVVVLRCVGA